MKQWVRKAIEDCDVTFRDISALCSSDLLSLYRGQCSSGWFPTGKWMREALWCKSDHEMHPVAIAAMACWGIFHQHEYGLVRFKDQTIVLERRNSILNLTKDNSPIGYFRYGVGLRWFYWGSASMWHDGACWGSIKLPLKGPSLYQLSDCCGSITLAGPTNIRFLLKGKDDYWKDVSLYERDWNDEAFIAYPPENSRSLFPQESKQIFDHLNTDERYMLVTAAIWARLFIGCGL